MQEYEEFMSASKKAAVDVEKIAEKQLDQITAAEFLSALDAGGLTAQQLTLWPEKKKVELWVEPENVGKVRVRDFIIVIRNEKKKVELEKHPGAEGWRENWREPREVMFDELVDKVTRNVEARMKLRLGF